MALTLFSRCEGTTLDGAHDYSAGDTTWTLASSAVFSTDGVKIGTNGLHTPSGDDYATLDAASIATPAQGTIAFWLRINTWGDGTRIAWLQGTAAGDRISIETGTTDELLIRHRVNGGNNITLATTAANITTVNWYFVQWHWHAANDDLRLEVYNSSGTLIQAVENLSAGLGGALADIISLNFGTVDNSARVSIDNVFIGSAYDDDFLASRDITSYMSYGGGGSAPAISSLSDDTYTNGQTGIVITGTSFGASQGSGSVKISPTDNVNDSNAVTQTVTSWGDTSITFTAVRSTLAPSTNLYLFVTANGGYSNASGHVVSFLQVVTVTNVSDTTLNDGQTSVTITGTDFQSTQGTGRVVISPTSDINNAGAVAQTVTSWGDTSITFTAVKGSLSLNTNLYLFVENDDDVVNSTGYTVQFVGIKKLLVQLPASAVGVTGISGVVWTKPGDTTQAGTEIGEFTGQSFESSAVGGLAVLKVPVSAFNGSSLTTSNTPVVLVQSSTHTTGLIEATIIEE